uniref:Bm13288 n=1 Tax=Brugia malayi TaxID=6279 RepID=A0A1I9G6R3_BRUMA|nr:Bm13288 [Brugia malayi]
MIRLETLFQKRADNIFFNSKNILNNLRNLYKFLTLLILKYLI